ncbi:hypothetical protein M2459_001496 [Parabacteroides sp. PF5-5]|uniref:alginate export family protein n=1 Tax=unclassified Parabacteroides TaxID=2649774 RepID=UPI002475C746|nr:MULTISPECIES: alginate export family protein [unclassified Parabacteroides]MDH6304759.1 hypothetical protein [Parabacteroides sp. PH5-39]MDH6315626.1 hypothetical protein [Parabacteroides sp. PF5-13]MDH6319287.1 hypothetical protein [Parabacteroides sp. PH5-13]MDH6323018.1 hypothetical protein [Parabacteroides sp. PH5-8]MDH6326819.1 hypothetical protein [Parabacteroides sp. PH5-41]
MKKWMMFFWGLLMCHFAFAEGNEANDSKENEFTIGVQIRPRAEYRNGVLYPRAEGAEPVGFINNRARMSMSYKRDKLSLGLSAQHVGVWGQDPQIDKNGRFILNEAWANLDLGNGFFAKLGRQSLVYDDDRILGSLDWNVAGRFHDALKLGYENPQNKLHLILAFNQNDEKTIGGTYYAPGAQPYKNMQTLWYQHIGSKAFNASFLLMNLGQEAGSTEEKKSDTKYLQTLGTNISYQPNAFSLYGTFYYQFGKTVASKDVSAYMFALNASYQINSTWKLMVATDYLSGDEGDPGDYKAFNPLYGTHHKFYGTMDYFYASPFINGMNPGLWDNQIGITYKASPKVTCLLNYHYFLTTADVYVDNKEQDKGLGSEIDLQLNWSIMKDVTLSAGYSMMFGTDAMQAVKGGHPDSWQDWGWVSLNINPKVFFSKW